MLKSKEIRAVARGKLQGRWGQMATISVLYILLTLLFANVVSAIGDSGSFINHLASAIYIYLIAFAISSSYQLTGLAVARKEPVQTGSLFKVFRRPYYTKFALLNICQQIIQNLISLIVAIPFSIVTKVSIFLFLFGNPDPLSVALQYKQYFNGIETSMLTLIVFLIIIVLICELFINFFVNMITFYMNDYPEESFGHSIKKIMRYLKGHWLAGIRLTLSFIGWDFLMIFFFPIFFVMPYQTTSFAIFYEEIKQD